MIRVQQESIHIETTTLTATIERGYLVSLRSRANGREFIDAAALPNGIALQLVYASGEMVGFADGPVTISLHQLADTRAEIRLHGWDADGVIVVSECPDTGDLLIEPSAYSSRPGVLACRWTLAGSAASLELVAPFFQGIKLPLDDPLIANSHWNWPISWEAGLAILQGEQDGCWVHTRDTRYRYKALKVGTGEDPRSLGFDTQAYGPVDNNLSAGGLSWRINVYQGDWRVPAAAYRDWLWQAYDLHPRAAQRKPWVRDITLAMSWCHSDPAILDALAGQVSPAKTLLHLSEWRTDPYDENYPSFISSAQAKAFVEKGKAMGFHILPHCNSIDMDPSHPLYDYLRDFQYRDIQSKRLLGWAWEAGRILGVPNSNVSLQENRRRKVMVKIHPGLAMWRSLLAENIQTALNTLAMDSVFIDVTLCSYNLHNALVENTTSTEGMKELIDHIAELNAGVVVAGEGLNEITMQGLSLAQAHLFNSHARSCAGLERAGGCPLNALLFDGLCRTFGYATLSGKTDDEQMRSRVHLSLGAIPTFTGLTTEEIRQPNPYIRELFALANAL